MNSIDQQLGNGQMNQAAVRVRKPQRLQVQMAIRCIDDLVGQDHQVRTVAAVAQTLDLSGFYVPVRSRHGHAGQSSTDPALLVCLWLYGSIRGIGSARELARRCDPNQASAPFIWLCGGVSVNHHMLSDFRVEHADALDRLFTQVIALLVSKGLVKVRRISQDGVRVRACAGAKSFRREQRLEELLEQSRLHVEELRKQLEDPAYSAGVSSRHKSARQRAARDKQHRLEQAIAQLPEMKQKQEQTAKKAGNGRRGKQIREKQPRVSSTDPQIRVMKMPNGGYNPAVNVQLASDTHSRAIVGVQVSSEGSDSAGLSEPMRQEVEQRAGQKVEQHLMDGGYLKLADIEKAHEQNVELFLPPKPGRHPDKKGKELEPKTGDSPAILNWKKRMSEPAGKEIYKLRAATSETVNADLRTYRGLTQLTVRSLPNARCIALWCALAYNLMHFGSALIKLI